MLFVAGCGWRKHISPLMSLQEHSSPGASLSAVPVWLPRAKKKEKEKRKNGKHTHTRTCADTNEYSEQSGEKNMLRRALDWKIHADLDWLTLAFSDAPAALAAHVFAHVFGFLVSPERP